MRIVIDLQGAQTASAKRGIGRYSWALTEGILRNRGEHEIILVLNGLYPHAIASLRKNLGGLIPAQNILVWNAASQVSYGNSANFWRRRAAELNREAFFASLEPDVLLITSLFEGFSEDAVVSIDRFSGKIPTAVILYDLIPLIYPEVYLGNGLTRDWYSEKIAHFKRADLWLAISESAREEGITRLGLKASSVFNISGATDALFRPMHLSEEQKAQALLKLGIRRSFILTLGGAETRKNIARLIQAFAGLPKKLTNNYQLAICGATSTSDRLAISEWRSRHSLQSDQLVLINQVSDVELAQLYNSCELFVFPSWHEGFGLPALEAMQCGAPTIASNATSLPEVVGLSDALFDPHSAADISAKIAKTLTDHSFRDALVEHGLQRAKNFTWDITAKKAIEALEKTQPRDNHPRARPGKMREDLVEAIGALPATASTPSDRDIMDIAVSITKNFASVDSFDRTIDLPGRIIWRIEGPFDSSYSLALLNRETARALSALGHHVALHSTEGYGDFLPKENFLAANPDLAELYDESKVISHNASDVVSRNLYPPRVSDMGARINLLHHYAWEESGFPQEWSENFSTYLNGMTCLSRHVEKIMIDHGVTCHLEVSGCGVDHWERIEADPAFQIKTARSFRFLHVSSCFPRKGADALLKAYGLSFSASDDVTLIIKTFPNPHNEIHKWLAEARTGHPEFPDVIILEQDLTEEQLKALYQQCHTLVAPSRAEGYGLPLAEAMLSGLPVITTAWGGQLDFCRKETAWLVDYEFEPVRSHFGLFDSVWASPLAEDLAAKMRDVYTLPAAEKHKRVSTGRNELLSSSRWVNVAERLEEAARRTAKLPLTLPPRIAWISTWNSRCGIAGYSAHLVRNMPSDVTVLAPRDQDLITSDEKNVSRCWFVHGQDDLKELRETIAQRDFDVVVIQFNFGFFDFSAFKSFLEDLHQQGRTVVVTLHATSDPKGEEEWVKQKRLALLREPLSRCARILVHAVPDLNRLKALGLIENVALFPHGVPEHPVTDGLKDKRNDFVIGSYGFFLPNKGLLELIEAFATLNERGIASKLQMTNAEYPVPISAELIDRASSQINKLGLQDRIVLDRTYRSDAESLDLLRGVDLLVFPYQVTGESSSAAVRYGLATGRPVAVTPLPIFDDVSPAVFKLPGCTVEDIANGIEEIIGQIRNGSELYESTMKEAARWRTAHHYSRLGRRLDGMLSALVRKSKNPSIFPARSVGDFAPPEMELTE